MLEKMDLPDVRIGCCVVVADVAFISGQSDAVREGLERVRQLLGTVDVLAESWVDGERSVHIRWCPVVPIR